MGTNIILALLALATGTLAARLLGPQGRGELAAIQIWPLFIASVAMLGLPDAVVYFSGRDTQKAGRYLTTSLCILLPTSALFMTIGYFLMPSLLAAQASFVVSAARKYLWLVLLYGLLGFSHALLRGKNDLVVWNVLKLAPPLGWLTVLLLAGALGRATPESLAAGYLVALAALVFPFLLVVWLRVPGSFRPEPRQSPALLRYGLPSLVGATPRLLNMRLDQLLMAAFLAPHSLGLYAVAVAWGGAMAPLLNAVGDVLFPHVASRKVVADQVSALAQGVRLGIVLAIGLCILLIFATPFVIPFLFGAKFSAAIPAALVLLVAAAVFNLNLILEEGLRGLGQPKMVMWAELAGFLTMFTALSILLGPLNILGAATASLLGHSAVAVSLSLQVQRLTERSLVQLFVPTRADIAGVLAKLRAIVVLAESGEA